MLAPFKDGFSLYGAERLAKTIRAYWEKRGKVVEVRTEIAHLKSSSRHHMGGDVWVVRSNMVRGLPPC